MKEKPTIYYVAHYSDMENKYLRRAAPAADLQVSYFREILNEIGYEVEILSPCVISDRNRHIIYEKGYTKIEGKNKVRFFPSVGSKYRVIRVVGYFLTKISLAAYTARKENKIIIIYHSLSLGYLYNVLRMVQKRFILEVEEVYSDVIRNEKKKNLELKGISKAGGYIIPNKLMRSIFSKKKKWVLYHGSCRNEPILKKSFVNDKINLVYAGTLDTRVIGDYAMIRMAKYLGSSYHIHILGVGTDGQKKRMMEEIRRVRDCGCCVTFHDCLYGNEYLAFLQSCDIGIYAQKPDNPDVYSSFPSKIMSYLSNGLRVVATRTPVLENSEVSDILYYSEGNEPDILANTIKGIDLSTEYDSRELLRNIEIRLKDNLSIFLDEF